MQLLSRGPSLPVREARQSGSRSNMGWSPSGGEPTGERSFHEGESMMRKLSTWLVVASAGGLLVTGCGSSTTSTQPAPAAATTSPTAATKASTTSSTTATKAPTTSATSPTTATSPGARPESKAQGVAACKQVINAQRTLPASEKVKLEAVCEKFAGTTPPRTSATGNVTALSNAARACLERLSRLPASAARLRALAACKAN